MINYGQHKPNSSKQSGTDQTGFVLCKSIVGWWLERPAARPKTAQTRPATREQKTLNRQTKAGSGYNRPTRIERDQYSRQRAVNRRQSANRSHRGSASSGRRG